MVARLYRSPNHVVSPPHRLTRRGHSVREVLPRSVPSRSDKLRETRVRENGAALLFDARYGRVEFAVQRFEVFVTYERLGSLEAISDPV
jgi:hypothetical protein